MHSEAENKKAQGTAALLTGDELCGLTGFLLSSGCSSRAWIFWNGLFQLNQATGSALQKPAARGVQGAVPFLVDAVLRRWKISA